MDVTQPTVIMAVVQAPCVRCKSEKQNFESTCDHILLINGSAIPMCKACLTWAVTAQPVRPNVAPQN